MNIDASVAGGPANRSALNTAPKAVADHRRPRGVSSCQESGAQRGRRPEVGNGRCGVTARMPDGDQTPDGDGLRPPAADEVWHRFLTDSEHAIRETAPKELSAAERGTASRTASPPSRPQGGGHTRRRPTSPLRQRPASLDGTGAVGELWQPTEPRPHSPWRELDGRAKCRRIVRALGTAAAITLALGLCSQLAAPGDPHDGEDDTVSQQSEQAPSAWPADTPHITAPPSG